MQTNRGKSPPSPYIVGPTATHTHSVILLHGLGSSGERFGSEFLETAIRSDSKKLKDLLPGARFIFPTAKRRRSSAFRRARLTQWFDIASLDDPSYRRHLQTEGLEESFHQVSGLLDLEIDKVGPSNVILGGLSQGMAMGIICLLAMKVPIGGFIGMSGWMPYRDDIQDLLDEKPEENSDDIFEADKVFSTPPSQDQDPLTRVSDFVRDLLSINDAAGRKPNISTPVFLGHGSADEKIAPSLGEDARDTLRAIGFRVVWEAYRDQGHWFKVPDQIDDIARFMCRDVGWALQENEA